MHTITQQNFNGNVLKKSTTYIWYRQDTNTLLPTFKYFFIFFYKMEEVTSIHTYLTYLWWWNVQRKLKRTKRKQSNNHNNNRNNDGCCCCCSIHECNNNKKQSRIKKDIIHTSPLKGCGFTLMLTQFFTSHFSGQWGKISKMYKRHADSIYVLRPFHQTPQYWHDAVFFVFSI